MSRAVMADAQFGISKILRPFTGFETEYQGEAISVPLLFSEDGKIKDSCAGKPGYDANLLPGVSVPVGARVILWLPIVKGSAHSFPDFADFYYRWTICWRLRNLFDFRTSRIPYHFPRQSDGVPYEGSTRVVIPAAMTGQIYSGEEPAGAGIDSLGNVYSNVWTDWINGRTDWSVYSNVPVNQDGVVAQGIIPSGSGQARQPTHFIHEVQACGDELLLFLTRPYIRNGVSRDTWDFTEVDNEITYRFGAANPSTAKVDGVYLMIGTSP